MTGWLIFITLKNGKQGEVRDRRCMGLMYGFYMAKHTEDLILKINGYSSKHWKTMHDGYSLNVVFFSFMSVNIIKQYSHIEIKAHCLHAKVNNFLYADNRNFVHKLSKHIIIRLKLYKVSQLATHFGYMYIWKVVELMVS